ncbi:SDR family NAD(P)-dependent oxidoreductase [Mycobacterium talmoniae]
MTPVGDRLLGKVTVITGAGSGIGAAMAAAMRAQGARVVVTSADNRTTSPANSATARSPSTSTSATTTRLPR